MKRQRIKIIILFMSKARQKEMARLREEKEQRQMQFQKALDCLIHEQETTRITLDFCKDYLQKPLGESLLEYSPTHISRQIFEGQLEGIRKEMDRMPNGECRIEHFILIVMRVMEFPFEKRPLYMVGLKDMFRQIVKEGRETVSYPEVFRYLVGQVIVMREEAQGTEFHIQFLEKKKQDYLLHDNGIKKIYYSTDLKVILSLDHRDNIIKIYNQDMRSLARLAARKQMHQGRIPQIIDFDYSEMTMRLGVIYSDCTIESIHLPNFLSKSQKEFETFGLNQLQFPLPKPMKQLHYLHMLNKWLTLSDQPEEVFLFDLEKVRSKPEEVEERVPINTNQMVVSRVLEIVPLSVICVVAGNELSFYSQTFSQQKITKFCHHEIIRTLRYCQEKNTFYLSGEFEKAITFFRVNRNRKSFKVQTKSINRTIIDFEVFPHFDTVLICDDLNNLRLLHQPSWSCFKEQSYGHIVKAEGEHVGCYKLGKTDFMVFQSYMVGLEQEKLAIEKQTQFRYLPHSFYDPRKEEFFFSLNQQIVSLSLPFGEVRRSLSSDSSNLRKHECFFLGKGNTPFIIDQSSNLYQVYSRSEENEGENKLYRKRVLLQNPVAYFYDQEMRNLMVVNKNTVTQIRNDLNNNFNGINNIHLEGFPRVVAARFCRSTKYLTLLTHDLLLYQLKNFETRVSKCFRVDFQKESQDIVKGTLLEYHYCHDLELMVVLSSNRQLCLFERLNPENQILVRVDDYLPSKLRHLNFSRFEFHIAREKGTHLPSVLLLDDSGYLLDIDLRRLTASRFALTRKEEKETKSFPKESYDVRNCGVEVEEVRLLEKSKVQLSPSQFRLVKAHDRKISIATKLKLEIGVVLTLGQDGQIKLWRHDYQNLFSLKLPSLTRLNWSMSEIHEIKNQKSIKDINQIIRQHYTPKNDSPRPFDTIQKGKQIKNSQLPKKFRFEEDLPLQIDSKDVQDIVLRQEDHLKNYLTSRRVLRPRERDNPELTSIDTHPWRTKREFLKIYERASPTNKYQKTMPRGLITLRNSLDMREKPKKKENYETAEIILPQLRAYESEAPRDDGRRGQQRKKKGQGEELQNFESCVYVKSERYRKKPNELDGIDREFRLKLIEMRNRRVKNHRWEERKGQTLDLTESTLVPHEGTSQDTIRDIQSVFEEHNRQAAERRKGRVIKVPQIPTFRGDEDPQ